MKKALIICLTLTVAIFVVSACSRNSEPSQVNNGNQSPSTSTPDNLSTSSSTATSTNLDTSTWKTYHNEEYGFEFKYPEGFLLSENESFVSIYAKPDALLTLTVGNIKKIPGQTTPSNKMESGVIIYLNVSKADDIGFDKIIEYCKINSENGDCGSGYRLINQRRVLVIENWYSLNRFQSLFFLSNDLLYDLSFELSTDNDIQEKYSSDLFDRIADTFIIFGI